VQRLLHRLAVVAPMHVWYLRITYVAMRQHILRRVAMMNMDRRLMSALTQSDSADALKRHPS
jgi:hypothetical protein